jgi:hypothetical protein
MDGFLLSMNIGYLSLKYGCLALKEDNTEIVWDR